MFFCLPLQAIVCFRKQPHVSTSKDLVVNRHPIGFLALLNKWFNTFLVSLECSYVFYNNYITMDNPNSSTYPKHWYLQIVIVK